MVIDRSILFRKVTVLTAAIVMLLSLAGFVYAAEEDTSDTGLLTIENEIVIRDDEFLEELQGVWLSSQDSYFRIIISGNHMYILQNDKEAAEETDSSLSDAEKYDPYVYKLPDQAKVLDEYDFHVYSYPGFPEYVYLIQDDLKTTEFYAFTRFEYRYHKLNTSEMILDADWDTSISFTKEADLSYISISQEEAAEIMEKELFEIIVDVRTQEEYADGHIPDAICIPNETIGDKMPEELPSLDDLILVYCRSGRRSKQAAEKLAKIGYTNIYEFGGINTWPGEIVQ